MKFRLTVGAEILQKYPVFVPDYLALKVRDGLEPFFADVALLYNVVSDGSSKLEAFSLQRNSKRNLCFVRIEEKARSRKTLQNESSLFPTLPWECSTVRIELSPDFLLLLLLLLKAGILGVKRLCVRQVLGVR